MSICNPFGNALGVNKNVGIYQATLDILIQKINEAQTPKKYYKDWNYMQKKILPSNKVGLISKSIKTGRPNKKLN